MFRWRSCIALLAATVLLSACGFRLQGTAQFPPELATVHIATGDTYTEFYRALRTELREQGVDVVDSVVAASAVITVLEDNTGQRVLTVSGRNVPTEFEVFYTVRYAVSVEGDEALAPRSLTALQDYTYDATLVLGKRREEENIRRALARDLVRQVSQQLTRI